MQSGQFLYDPALDDGGGGPSADLPGASSREQGDPIYPGSFQPFIGDYSDQQPPSMLPQMPFQNPIPSLVPLDGQAYHYLRSSSSSLAQANTSRDIYSHIYYSPSNVVPGHLDGAPDVPMYQPIYPVSQGIFTGQSGLTEHSQWAAFPSHDYSDHTSISPLRDKSFRGFHGGLPGGSEPYEPPLQNHVNGLRVNNEHDYIFTNVLPSYPASQQPTPGPLVTASGSYHYPDQETSPNTATLTDANIWVSQPQGIGVDFAMASSGSRAHHASYAAPSHLPWDHNPFSFTGDQSFDSSMLYSPPDYPAHRQEPQHHPGYFRNPTSTHTFDSVGIGTMPQGVRLHGDAGRTLSISDPPMPPLEQHSHAPTTWLGPIPHHDPSNSGMPTTHQCHKSPPQTVPFSPEASGYASRASHTDSSDVASPSPPTAVATPIRFTRQHDTPQYGGLNTFLSQPASRGQVRTRSTHCRAKVLNRDEIPPNLLPYYQNHRHIPLPEYSTLFTTTRDGEFCSICDYDVTYPGRRRGLKYEHANVHLNNRPFQCLDCGKRYCRPTAHPKSHPIRLPPSHN